MTEPVGGQPTANPPPVPPTPTPGQSHRRPLPISAKTAAAAVAVMLAGAGGFGLGNASSGSAGPRAAASAGGPTSLTDALTRIQSDLDAAQVFATSSPSATVSPSPTSSPSVTASPSPSTSPSPTPSSSLTQCLPVPSLCGFPDVTNTGVPSGTALTPKSGGMTVTVAGTVVNAIDLAGTLNINASNVTVQNSLVTAGANFGIHLAAGVTGVKVTDVTIVGTTGCQVGMNAGEFAALRVNVSGCEDGFQVSAGTSITDSYIHDLRYTATSHNDGIQVFDGNGQKFVHNTIIDAAQRGNAAIFLQPYSGPITNATISDNLLDGAGYTVKVEKSSGVVIARNILGPHFRWGWISSGGSTRFPNPIKPTLTGNVFDATGLPAT